MFDEQAVGRGDKRHFSDLPAGESRVDIPPTGATGVWVNGQRVVGKNGPIADCGKPGMLIRAFPA